jgi:VWFA-related protein
MFVADTSAQRGVLDFPRVSAVHVSAVDRNGAPVVDLSAKDFVLKENGEVREIVKVQPATATMHVAIIVDDSGTGIFRYGVAKFVDQLLGHAQFSIRRVVGQVRKLVSYTTDLDQLRQAVLSLNAMSATPAGGQVVEGIFEASQELRARDAQRSIIIVLSDTDAAYSSLPARQVLEQLRQSGVVLYVIALARLPVQTTPNVSGVASTAVAADKPSDLLDRRLDVNEVLGDGPKQTGGRRAEMAGSAGPIRALQEIADELNHQYLVTYLVPAGEKADQKISVAARRRGLTVRSPSRAVSGTP